MKMNQITKALDGNSSELRSNQHFPSARYFQVHFEYLHEIIRDLKAQIDTANQQIMVMQAQLQAVKQQEVILKPNHQEQRSRHSKMRQRL
jgi:cell division protein FtsB